MKTNFASRSRGFTLVELLVAITVLTIVVALIIPRLRIVNKERNIRETARLIGSAVSSARDRAVNDGSGGFVIERNLNFVIPTNGGANRVYFAGTRLIEMKATPPFVGDSDDDYAIIALVDNGNGDYFYRCFIPFPFEHDVENDNPVVRPNDTIRFAGSNAEHIIAGVLDPVDINIVFPSGTTSPEINGQTYNSPETFLPLDLAYEVASINLGGGNFAPDLSVPDRFTGFLGPPISPLDGDAVILAADAGDSSGGVTIGPFMRQFVTEIPSFVINRQPRKVQSSAVNLPPGYFIDLRYSGPLEPIDSMGNDVDGDMDTHTVFGLSLDGTQDEATIDNREIRIFFNKKGAIHRISANGFTDVTGGSLYFYVDEYDPNEIVVGETALQSAARELSSPDNLWVTVGNNGGTNIGYNAPPINVNDIRQLIGDSRSTSRIRTSALQ